MGKFAKWLGAGAGFTMGGPIGAIIGFAVGSFIDGVSIEDFTKEQQEIDTRVNGNSNHKQIESELTSW